MTHPFAVAAAAAAVLRGLIGAATVTPATAPATAAVRAPASAPPPPSLASPAPATPNATAIEITVAGSGADLVRVRALVRTRAAGITAVHWRRVESFDPLDILRAGPDADARAPAIRCWIDLTDRRRAHLYFAGRSGARFLIRDVELSGKFDELDLTSLAEVIDSSLTAVIENDLAGLTRAEAERVLEQKRAVPPGGAERPPARPVERPVERPAEPAERAVAAPATPPAVARARARPGVGAGVFYAAQTFASEPARVSGPGLIVSVAIFDADAGWQIGAWLSGQYQLEASASGELAGVRLATIATRAGLLALRPLGGVGERGPDGGRRWRWAIEARAGAGADAIHLTPEPGTVDASAVLTPARWSTNLALTGAAGVVAALGESERVRLGVRAFADVLPVAAHYDVAVAGQPMIVVAPDRLRPGLAAELTVVLGGADR